MKLLLGLFVTILATQAFAGPKKQPIVALQKVQSEQTSSYYYAIAQSLRDKKVICVESGNGAHYELGLIMHNLSSKQAQVSMIFDVFNPALKNENRSWSMFENDNSPLYAVYVDQTGQQPVIRFMHKALEDQLNKTQYLSKQLFYEFAISTDPTFSEVVAVAQILSTVVDVNAGSIVAPNYQRQRQLLQQNTCQISPK